MLPQECLKQRFVALQQGDYAAVFFSYHEDSPFRQQFSEPEAYGCFAVEHLSQVSVHSWNCEAFRCLSADQVECLLVIDTAVAGALSRMFELALLIRTAAGWRYHSAQKLNADAVGQKNRIPDFSDFDSARQKVRF